jgi:hypothetical protein
VSFYVSTAIYFLLHCDKWDHFVAPRRHKFVTGATLLQLVKMTVNWYGWKRNMLTVYLVTTSDLPKQKDVIKNVEINH